MGFARIFLNRSDEEGAAKPLRTPRRGLKKIYPQPLSAFFPFPSSRA
jgi:hypothetical protein